MLDYIEVEQNTDEWLALRAGKLTSSKMGTIMANYGKAFGEPAKKYAANIAIEQITGEPIPSDYSNAHMERGHEQEPLACRLYEYETFCDVANGAFFGGDFVGCSPDGLVDDDGLIEIKSVITTVHYANIKRQNVDPAYKWQILGNLMFTGRDWIDFISYCQNFPEHKRLFVWRLFKDNHAKEFEMMQSRIAEFKELVATTKKSIIELNYINQ